MFLSSGRHSEVTPLGPSPTFFLLKGVNYVEICSKYNSTFYRLSDGKKNWVWLGGLLKKGKFVWDSDGSKLSYAPWEKGQPNNRDKYGHFLLSV